MQFNPEMLANASAGRTVTGEVSMNDVQEMKKALSMGYGSDVSTLQGGAALRIQSLDKTMMATIQQNKHFALFNELQKQDATATVDEWTEMSGVGGFLGGSTNTETGSLSDNTGSYARRVGLVKFLMTKRSVSFVSTLGNNIVEAEAIEHQAGALQLLTDAEFLSFEGDSTIVPTEFDGIGAQIASLGSADHVIDMRAGPLNKIDGIDQAAAVIAGFGNFGQPSHIFWSNLTQSDMNTSLDPAFRINLDKNPESTKLGAPVKGINTSWGEIKTVSDVFVRDEPRLVPFEVLYPTVAVLNNAYQPTLAAAANVSGGASSQWAAAQAGAYYYAVTGITAAGESQAVVSGQVTVAQGGSVTLTITKSASASETGYAIYRGRLNGTNALTDLRLMKRIPAAVGATTTFTDLNADIPGTTKAYMLNMTPGMNAITWRQLLPMTKFPLYPTNSAVIPWAQMLFGYLRITKRNQHVVFKNILPSGAQWRPFN